MKFYPSVREIPGPVDYVISSIPSSGVLELMDDCVPEESAPSTSSPLLSRDWRSAAGGVGATGAGEGPRRQRAHHWAELHGDVRACLGLSFGDDFPSGKAPSRLFHRAELMPKRSSATRPCAASTSARSSHRQRRRPGRVRLLRVLRRGPDTAIITSYLEGIKDGGRFRRALMKAAAAKPVVILKGGATGAGHTGGQFSHRQPGGLLCRMVGADPAGERGQRRDARTAGRHGGDVPLPRPAVRPRRRDHRRGRRRQRPGGRRGGTLRLAGAAIPPDLQSELREFIPVAGSSVRNPLDTHASTITDSSETRGNPLRVPEIHNLVAVARIDWVFGRPNADMDAFLASW